MKKRNLSKNLRIQVRKYLEYMHTEDNEGFQRGENLINFLSKTLKDKIKIETYKSIFKKTSILNNYNDLFIQKLATKIKEFTAAPDEIICEVFLI